MTDRALAFGFSVRAADFDQDGDLDLYVANDSDANYLYRNDGKGRFEEVGLWSGCALDKNGAAQAGMGLAVGDANEDGRPDTDGAGRPLSAGSLARPPNQAPARRGTLPRTHRRTRRLVVVSTIPASTAADK